MKLKFLIFNFSFLILTACGVTKPVATTHTERIEQHVMPVAVGADTIEIVLSHTDNILHTERTECTEDAVATPAEDRLINDFEQSEKSNSVSSVGSVRNKNSSVREKENSVRNKNPVRISSTRGVNISRYETDTTSMLRITLQPDTVFVPYTNHIRSDTIVVPDRVCNEKLKQTKFMNVILLILLILFVATIIYRKIFHK